MSPQQHFIYILKLTPQYEDMGAWTTKTEAIIGEHLEHLQALAKKGVVKHIGRTNLKPGDPDLFGVCILQAPDEDAAYELMMDDPTVREGVMTARLFPYNLVY